MENDSHNRSEPENEPATSDYPEYPRHSFYSGPRFPINFKTLSIFFGLFGATVYTTWWVGGPWYAFGLILILATHEFGHYWACRVNNVNSSLPNFIPMPALPFFLNIGTMGAFIIIKEPIPNRKALMEIGASGPIAGFIVAVPVLVVGLMNSQVIPVSSLTAESPYIYGSSLILWGLTEVVLGVNFPLATGLTLNLHPLAFAGWLGMFFTALNLLPMGQLDGGHIMYSLFQSKHKIVARSFFVLLLLLGWQWGGWWLWAGLVFLLGLNHPPVLDESAPLSPKHRMIGYVSIAILILTFVPVPFALVP